jgi:hypothetical protein
LPLLYTRFSRYEMRINDLKKNGKGSGANVQKICLSLSAEVAMGPAILVGRLATTCRRLQHLNRSFLAYTCRQQGPTRNAMAAIRIGGRIILCTRLAVGVMQTVPTVEANSGPITFETTTSGGKGFLLDLKQVLLDLVSTLLTLLRALQLAVICAPLLAFSPLAYHNERYRERWFLMLVSTLESCGPIHVKLGQWASTRRDLFPHRMCQVLTKLQRRIREHSWRETEENLKRNYGEECMDEVFADFDREPVGSGCCAQVYKATLVGFDGLPVAVKVLHPNVEDR